MRKILAAIGIAASVMLLVGCGASSTDADTSSATSPAGTPSLNGSSFVPEPPFSPAPEPSPPAADCDATEGSAEIGGVALESGTNADLRVTQVALEPGSSAEILVRLNVALEARDTAHPSLYLTVHVMMERLDVVVAYQAWSDGQREDLILHYYSIDEPFDVTRTMVEVGFAGNEASHMAFTLTCVLRT